LEVVINSLRFVVDNVVLCDEKCFSNELKKKKKLFAFEIEQRERLAFEKFRNKREANSTFCETQISDVSFFLFETVTDDPELKKRRISVENAFQNETNSFACKQQS
jgi:hypothetical protein